MDKYAFYSYSFEDVPIEGDCFEGEQVLTTDTSDMHRRSMLDHLFGHRNTSFTIKKYRKHDADDLPTTVLAHPERIVLLRVENPKEVKVWEKSSSPPGEVASIKERRLPSNPFSYVLIDCRERGQRMMAIRIDSSAWRNTDIVAQLLQDNINKKLKSLSRGFAIKIKPVLMEIDFVEHSRFLIKRKKIPVTKMTVYFTHGLISPRVEEIIKNDAYLRELTGRMFEASNGEVTYNYPNGNRILDRRGNMLEHIVTLIGSEPNGAFRLRMTYDDGTSYTCGKDVRIEFEMDEMAFMGMLGVGNLFPEQDIGAWFDDKAQKIEEQRHAETFNKNRTSTFGRLLQAG